MSKILIKGIVLNGRYSGPADNYEYEESLPPGPTDLDTERTYRSLDEFLRSEGRPVISERVRHLPFIKEGIISPSVAASCYFLDCCLIANGFLPNFYGIAHLVQAAARLEDKNKIDETLAVLKYKAGLRWTEYWQNFNDEQIVDVPEQLENIRQLVHCLPELLTA